MKRYDCPMFSLIDIHKRPNDSLPIGLIRPHKLKRKYTVIV